MQSAAELKNRRMAKGELSCATKVVRAHRVIRALKNKKSLKEKAEGSDVCLHAMKELFSASRLRRSEAQNSVADSGHCCSLAHRVSTNP